MNDDLPVSTSPFSKLPDLMKMLTGSEVFPKINIEIEKQNGLTVEQGDKMMDVIRKVVLKTIEPRELLANIQKTIGLNENKAKKLALDLLGRQFLPMQWYIGDVEGEIKKLGGDVAKYETEARKNYPEVYEPHAQEPEVQTETSDVVTEKKEPASVRTVTSDTNEPTILHSIDDRLTTNKGRAEVLLRLTALSQQIEEAGKAKTLNENEAQELMHSLDTLSYAVNTQDLNPLEIAAIKRRLKNILAKLPSSS